MLDPHLARQRQRRLLERVQSRKLDAVVVADPQHVYYLSAFRPTWLHFAGLILFSDSRSLLVSANAPAARFALGRGFVRMADSSCSPMPPSL